MSRGEAWLAGHPITSNLNKAQREIGVCPQFDVFYPQLSAYDHVMFFGRLKGVGLGERSGGKYGLEAEVERVLKEVGLWEEHREKAAKSLSGGMKRRLSLGTRRRRGDMG